MFLLPYWLRRLSFERQLGIVVSAGIIGAALFLSLISSWQGSEQIRATLIGQGQQIAESLANNSKLALLYASAENVSEAVNTTLAFPDVIQVEILYPDGQSLLVRGRANVSLPPTPTLLQSIHKTSLEVETAEAWRFIAPVTTLPTNNSPFEAVEQKNELIGYVRVVQSKSTLIRMLTRVIITNLLFAVVFAALFVGLSRMLAKRLTQPITALSQTMARAQAGELNVEARLAGSRDIAEMAQAFNSMMAALREREIALRQSEEKYREVIESVREVIFQTDSQGLLVFLNPAWLETTGYSVHESLGKALVNFLEAESQQEFLQRQAHMRQTSNVTYYRFEVCFMRSNNTLAWLDVTQRPNYDEQGQWIGTSGTLDDITDRRVAEQALKTLNQELEMRVAERTLELETSNRELEAFSYSVSHDLRAPLRSISGFASILLNEYAQKLEEKCIGYIQRIRQSAHRMGDLIDDLIGLARINRATLYRHAVNLNSIAEQIFQELQEAEATRQVELIISEDLLAQADPTLMRVMLYNLLSNAWKYSAKKVDARIEFSSFQQEGQRIFYVRDNGAGFDMEHASQLFRPFSRLHAPDQFSGTGIGLATVQRVIERHGGRVWAEATVGQGATFYFTLPVINE